MDGLIVILLIIGLMSGIGRKKKKEQQRRRQAGFNEAAQARRNGAKPFPAAGAPELPDMEDTAAKQVKIPYTREEWSKFLKENAPAGTKTSAQKDVSKAILRSGDATLISDLEAGQAKYESGEGREFQKLNAQRLTAEKLRPDAKHHEGESHAEHAGHKLRIAAEEEALRRERAELQELRNVNLKKLRAAVVMSEVLGKPVALRGGRRG